MTPAPGFTGSPLDRADHLRGDDAAIAGLRVGPDARLLRLDGLDPEIDDDGRLIWDPIDGADADLAFLGLLDGAPRFVALTSGVEAARRSMAIFAILNRIAAAEAATYAAARSLIDWHARHGFCANCGQVTALFRAGWARRCPGCATEHYPRTDPVAIMLAEHDGRVLVARQASWPANNYSALAGFIEVGESVEEAVARELFEEAGVRASNVRFVASQPWPFPSQLMIACLATADSEALVIDHTELETGMWVTRDEVRLALARDPAASFQTPPTYAIAHTLLSYWVAGE